MKRIILSLALVGALCLQVKAQKGLAVGSKAPVFTGTCLLYTSPSPRDRG